MANQDWQTDYEIMAPPSPACKQRYDSWLRQFAVYRHRAPELVVSVHSLLNVPATRRVKRVTVPRS